MLIVIDASALAELVLWTEKGVRVADRVFGSRNHLHAPEIIDLEVAEVLRKLTLRGEIDEGRAARAFLDAEAMLLDRHTHGTLMRRIWQHRQNMSAYDASYVALAEALDASLLTFDQRLVRAAEPLVDVEFV